MVRVGDWYWPDVASTPLHERGEDFEQLVAIEAALKSALKEPKPERRLALLGDIRDQMLDAGQGREVGNSDGHIALSASVDLADNRSNV